MIARRAKSDFTNSAFIVIPAFGFILGYLIARLPYLQTVCPKRGDYALIALKVLNADRFGELTGPYSRFGFNHPLPSYFYLYDWLEPLLVSFDFWLGKYQMSQFIINMTCLVLAALVVQGLTASLFSTLIFFCLSLIFVHVDHAGMLINIWGPATLVCPLILVLVSSSGVIFSKRLSLFSLSIGLVLLSSNHVSGAFLSFMILVALLVIVLTGKFRGTDSRFSIVECVISFIIFVLGFSPLVLDFLLNGLNSNLLRILAFAKNSDANNLLSASFDSFINLFSILGSGYSISLLICFLFFLFLISCTFFAKPYQRTLSIFVLLTSVAVFYYIHGIRGEVFEYLLYFFRAVQCVGIWLVFDVGVRYFKLQRGQRLTSVFVGILLLSGSLHYFARKERSCRYELKAYLDGHLIDKASVVGLKMRNLKSWSAAALVAYELSKEGYKVCPQKDFYFMFGNSVNCPEGSQATKQFSFTYDKKAKEKRQNSYYYEGNTRIEFTDLLLK